MIGWKLMRKYSNGVYGPLYVGTDDRWRIGDKVFAKEGDKAEDGVHVKSKLGDLAYRPGLHLNYDAPHVEHIYSMHNGVKYMKDGCVWVEVEYSSNINYQNEARENGWLNGRWAPKRAQLDHVPTDGYYKYKTSSNMRGWWVICGWMKLIREVPWDEVDRLCREKGLVPLPVYRKEVA